MQNIKKLLNNNKWNKIYNLVKNDKVNLRDVIQNDNNLLHIACVNNQNKLIKIILKKDPSLIYLANGNGDTCVHLLSSFGYDKLLKELLSKYSYASTLKNNEGKTYFDLHKNGDVINVPKHIRNNYDLLRSHINKSDNTDKYYNKIKVILKNGDIKQDDIDILLINAAKKNKKNIVSILLEHNANPDARDDKFLTSLIYSVKANNYDIAKLLIEYGANVNYSGPEGDDNLMMIAIIKNNMQIVDLLLKSNFDVNMHDRYYDTPLHIALLKKDVDKNIVFKLLHIGNINAKNIDMNTPLYLLIKNHDWKDYVEILKNKKKIDITDHKDNKSDETEGGASIKKMLELRGEFDIFKKMVHPAKIIYSSNFDKLLLKTNNVIIGKFNSNIIHNMIYTIIILSKYNNLSIPFQHIIINKVEHDRRLNASVKLCKDTKEIIINDIVLTYTNMFYQLAPYIILWNSENNYYIHKDILFMFDKSIYSKNIRFIFTKVTLVSDSGSTHANILIYDKKKGTMERFDPYGDVPYLNTDLLDYSLEKYFAKYFATRGLQFKYLSPKKLFGGVGFQIFSNDETSYTKKLGDPVGYCLAWTFWYLEQRLANSNINPTELIKKLHNDIIALGKNEKDNGFINHIRNYASTLDNLKNNFMISAGVKSENIYDVVMSDSNLKLVLLNLNKHFKYMMGQRIEY